MSNILNWIYFESIDVHGKSPLPADHVERRSSYFATNPRGGCSMVVQSESCDGAAGIKNSCPDPQVFLVCHLFAVPSHVSQDIAELHEIATKCLCAASSLS